MNDKYISSLHLSDAHETVITMLKFHRENGRHATKNHLFTFVNAVGDWSAAKVGQLARSGALRARACPHVRPISYWRFASVLTLCPLMPMIARAQLFVL